MKKIQVTKHEFLRIYFLTLAINRLDAPKITETEIRVLLKLIELDEKKNGTSPYYGSGREAVMHALRMKNSQYSNVLKSLTKKKFLIPLAKKGEYSLSIDVIRLLQKVNESRELAITNYYEITEKESKITRRSVEDDGG